MPKLSDEICMESNQICGRCSKRIDTFTPWKKAGRLLRYHKSCYDAIVAETRIAAQAEATLRFIRQSLRLNINE